MRRHILIWVPVWALIVVWTELSECRFRHSEQSKVSPDELFISEFEILDMSNHDGRLQNGYCCNGQRASTTVGCKGGNTTCLPYWRICIVESAPESGTSSNLAQSNDPQGREGDNLVMVQSSTTKKPSMLNNFLSKIFGTSKSYSDHHRTKRLRDIIDHMSLSTCTVGFWSSDVISPDTSFPIRLRRPLIWRSATEQQQPQPQKSQQPLPESRNSAATDGATTKTRHHNAPGTIDRNVMCIVEIWSKNPQNDIKNRLITRQVFHYNIFMEPSAQSSEWFYGNKQLLSFAMNGNAATGSPNDLVRRKDSVPVRANYLYGRHSALGGGSSHYRTLAPKQATVLAKPPFRYKFRWQLRSLAKLRPENGSLDSREISKEEEYSLFNLTSEGCPHGFRGPECTIPVCSEGCNPEHGYCEQPGQCLCRFGWTGMSCNYCLTLPGCVHGSCNRPLECRCEEGWTGMFCSIPKCKDGCHSNNGYCISPEECKCKFGWQNENCTDCATLPGCQHGSCNDPLDCNCEPGWQGTFCSTPICAPGCENGWCSRPGECRCKIGFKGLNCTECVPYPGCEHGTCLYGKQPWTCDCEPNWGGMLCSEPLNWCEQNQNPCQNLGTCVSVENGDYRCQCSIGYSGKRCELVTA